MYFVGYYYNSDGSYERHEPVLETVKAVADFVTSDFRNKLVCNIWDLPVVTTIGPFLDKVDANEINYSDLLKEVLINQNYEDEEE